MFPWDRPQCRSPPLKPCRSLEDKLRIALLRSNMEDFWDLIKQGADVNVKDRHGQTMLHKSLYWKKDISIVTALLTAGINPRWHDYNDESVFDVAMRLNSDPLIKEAILNAISGTPPISYAVKFGDLKLLKRLIEAGAKLDFRHPSTQCTLLHQANKPDIARELINQGLDMEAVDINGMTPLHVAVQEDIIDVANVLIAAGADVHRLVHSNNCMHLARSALMVKMLASHNVDINALNLQGETPLFTLLSICKQYFYRGDSYIRSDPDTHTDIRRKGIMGLKEMIKHGADVNTICADGKSVLELALTLGDPKIVSYMIKYGARAVRKSLLGSVQVDISVMRLFSPFSPDLDDKRGLRLLIRESLIENVQGENLFYKYLANARCSSDMLDWLTYANLCRAEIERMERTKINCEKTIYHYIVKIGSNVKALRSCTHYKMTDEDKRTLFPIYRNKIAVRVNECYRRAGLLDLLEKVHVSVSVPSADGQGVVCLINDCKLAIAEFLSNKQLYKLLLAMGMEVGGSDLCAKPMKCAHT